MNESPFSPFSRNPFFYFRLKVDPACIDFSPLPKIHTRVLYLCTSDGRAAKFNTGSNKTQGEEEKDVDKGSISLSLSPSQPFLCQGGSGTSRAVPSFS